MRAQKKKMGKTRSDGMGDDEKVREGRPILRVRGESKGEAKGVISGCGLIDRPN